jgi:hypothetical protein
MSLSLSPISALSMFYSTESVGFALREPASGFSPIA